MIQGQMKVLYLNANSLFNKLTELMVLSAAEDVQVICITVLQRRGCAVIY